jgi:hypothetical protein
MLEQVAEPKTLDSSWVILSLHHQSKTLIQSSSQKLVHIDICAYNAYISTQNCDCKHGFHQNRVKKQHRLKLENLLAANHLLLVVLPCQSHQWGFNDSSSQSQYQVQCWLCIIPNGVPYTVEPETVMFDPGNQQSLAMDWRTLFNCFPACNVTFINLHFAMPIVTTM